MRCYPIRLVLGSQVTCWRAVHRSSLSCQNQTDSVRVTTGRFVQFQHNQNKSNVISLNILINAPCDSAASQICRPSFVKQTLCTRTCLSVFTIDLCPPGNHDYISTVSTRQSRLHLHCVHPAITTTSPLCPPGNHEYISTVSTWQSVPFRILVRLTLVQSDLHYNRVDIHASSISCHCSNDSISRRLKTQLQRRGISFQTNYLPPIW